MQNDIEKQLLDKISKGENIYTDFKFEISDSRKISRSISAFANTLGGSLLVGVKDNGRIAGIKSDEEYYMIQGAVSMYTRPKAVIEYKIWQVKGKKVLEVIVSKSSGKVIYAQDENQNWKAYVRVHDQNQLAPVLLEKIWKKKNTKGILLKYSVAESILLQHLAKNKVTDQTEFKKIATLSDKEADEILSDLATINVVDHKMVNGKLIFRLNPGFKLDDYFLG